MSKTLTIEVPDDHVVVSMPAASYDTIIETLGMDAQSSAFDQALRDEIAAAVDSISEHHT